MCARRIVDQCVSGLELADVLVDRERARDVAERQVQIDRGLVDRAGRIGGEQRRECAREREALAVLEVVQRLLAESVARQHELVRFAIVDAQRPHAVQPRKARFAELLVREQDHFGVAAARKHVATRLELCAQAADVVDLAVVDDPVILRGVVHRLMAGRRQIDDAQAPVPECDFVAAIRAGVVRTAVRDRLVHRGDQRVVAPVEAVNPAHDRP